MRMLSDQKRRKLIHSAPVGPPTTGSSVAQPGQSTRSNVWTPCPPIHAWMPNQPHETRALASAGRFVAQLDPPIRMLNLDGHRVSVPLQDGPLERGCNRAGRAVRAQGRRARGGRSRGCRDLRLDAPELSGMAIELGKALGATDVV